MPVAASDFDGQSALFKQETEKNIPPQLSRATLRLEFPPSYVIVGVYRLLTDKLLFKSVWDKCRHGVRRGAIVGGIWTFLTFSLQRKFIQIFLKNSPRITGLSDDTIFGYPLPFTVHTYAAVLLLGSQITTITRFSLSRNLNIAKDRAWAQTMESRGKGPQFWQPYVEEWDQPPVVNMKKSLTSKMLEYWIGRMVIKKLLLLPFDLYPFVGPLISAWLKALGTSRQLHRRYFEAKKMTEYQTAVFIEERKWDYRIFGFTAAFLEGMPIIGLLFTISNRVGAAMWAHDLEKRQHFVASDRQKRNN